MDRNVSILVVDDDTAHRTMLTTLLSGWGYTLFEANDGEPAIEMVKTAHYDLILMDIRMLKISGIEAMAVIKRINPAIPIIIMTAYASMDLAEKARNTGACDYLTKPIDFGNLRHTIQQFTAYATHPTKNGETSPTEAFSHHSLVDQTTLVPDLLDSLAHTAATPFGPGEPTPDKQER